MKVGGKKEEAAAFRLLSPFPDWSLLFKAIPYLNIAEVIVV